MSVRVVIADDHQIVREGVRRLLAEVPGDPPIQVVGEAEDGARALDLIGSLRPDVLVLDLALPAISGLEVCRHASAQGARVVVLTMHVSAEHVARAKAAGALAYVVKGLGVTDLAQAIRRAASGQLGPFPPTPDDPLSTLTSREREVFREIASGLTNREIAVLLGVSTNTVNTHRMRLMDKLGVHDAVALVSLAFRSGLVS